MNREQDTVVDFDFGRRFEVAGAHISYVVLVFPPRRDFAQIVL